jgi:hypothetical protein
MARRRQAEYVMLHETVNHQVHLLWSFEPAQHNANPAEAPV